MIDYSTIPETTKDTLDNWEKHALPPGSFGEAVLTNDLQEAFACADDDNIAAMHSIVAYVYNKIPGACHGSVERFRDWPARLRAEKAGK
jgi:hypothetical protein